LRLITSGGARDALDLHVVQKMAAERSNRLGLGCPGIGWSDKTAASTRTSRRNPGAAQASTAPAAPTQAASRNAAVNLWGSKLAQALELGPLHKGDGTGDVVAGAWRLDPGREPDGRDGARTQPTNRPGGLEERHLVHTVLQYPQPPTVSPARKACGDFLEHPAVAVRVGERGE
jgi:hypothetical protein